MMASRQDSIGIKQVIPYEWLRKSARFVLAGMDVVEIRRELHSAIAAAGKQVRAGERSKWTRTFLVNNLMTIWPSPNTELAPFRDLALRALRSHPAQELVVHWAMISATYPFWFNAAKQTGRLLNLQAQTTQTQIVSRLKEQYGDRQTISRYARFIVRSFLDWGVLESTAKVGCYQRADSILVTDQELATLLLHSALLATPEGRAPFSVLLHSPAFFPFLLPAMTGDFLAGGTGPLKLIRHGLDEELVSIAP